MASCDRDRLMNDIRSGGARLRPTKTIDKSKPILLVEGERLKTVAPLMILEQKNQGCPPPAPPPPPPPPPPSTIPNFNATLPKRINKKQDHEDDSNQKSIPIDRDALMQAIRQGVPLRKVKNGIIDNSKSIDQKPMDQKSIDQRPTDQKSIDHKSIDQKSMTLPRQNSHSANNSNNIDEIRQLDPTRLRPTTKQNSLTNSNNYQNGKSESDPSSISKISTFNRRENSSSTKIDSETSGDVDVESITQKWTSQAEFTLGESKSYCPLEKIFPSKSNFEQEKRLRPQKLPLTSTRSDSSSTKIDQDDNQKNEFTLNGFVNEAKAIWEKRSSNDENSPQAQQSIQSISKSNDPKTTALRFFNGPDYPESVSTISTPSSISIPPIVVDTNLLSTPEISKKICLANEFCQQRRGNPGDENGLPKVDDLRRAYEKIDNSKPVDQSSSTLRRQSKSQISNQRSESLDANGAESRESPSTPAAKSISTSKSPARFLPDVGALKQRFEEKAMEERNNRSAKTTPAINASQQQQSIVNSNASSGYSSGSPSPKSSENGHHQHRQNNNNNRFQYNAHSSSATLPNEHRRSRSGNSIEAQKSINNTDFNKSINSDSYKSINNIDFNKSIKSEPSSSSSLAKRSSVDESSKGSYVANNPHSETVGPFKASMATLGLVGESNQTQSTVKKNRNFYNRSQQNLNGNQTSEINSTQQQHHHHQNGNANETATWIVKKGAIPNIVTKYAVCEHLEALHQRKFNAATASSSVCDQNAAENSNSNLAGNLNLAPNSNSAGNSNSNSKNGAKCNEELIDGEVARLLGIPFEKLKELRFDIDVNDPEGSLLRIQKRYNNEVS